MSKKKKPYSDSRWHDIPVGKIVGHFPITEEQRKRGEKFRKDFAELMKKKDMESQSKEKDDGKG